MKPERLPRHRTGDPDLDRRLVELLDAAGVERNRDQLFEILSSVVRLAQDGADRLNLKITNAALKEMRSAFKVFAPYQNTPKVTIFGSARTLPDDPLYAQTRDLARGARRPAAGWSSPARARASWPPARRARARALARRATSACRSSRAPTRSSRPTPTWSR